jgi:RNA polymerase sigma factor (sigma-70 family)
LTADESPLPQTPRSTVAGLVETHGSQLRRFLLKRVRNAADVPDLVQEIFLRMLRIPNQDAVRSPEAYLFTVAQHVAQQHSMRESASPPAVDVTTLVARLEAAPDADPAAQASTEQILERLDRTLDRFSPKVRATFILHRHYGLSLEQISKELGISFPMAKKYLVKALVQIRQHLEDPD